MSKKSILLTSISVIALCAPVYAQNATATSPNSVEQVVVTGTRILANGDSLPTPVTVVSTESLLATTPSSISDALKKLPEFANSRGPAIQGDATDNAVGNYLNLRSFGIQRNLILFDGHRVAPTSYTGAVDANVLPQMLLQRVDIVTGGASATYGSDAVSGVVNFVLNKKFDGLKAEANTGISGQGDAFTWRAAGAYGTSFADGRGHLMASYEHFQQDGILKEARTSGQAAYAVAGSGSQADPYRLIQNARNALISFRGSIFSGPLAGQVFTAPGVTGPFVHGTSQGGTLESGGEGFYGKGSSATADVRTDQGFARADYDLTDDMHIYAQGMYAKSFDFNYFYPNLFFPLAVPSDNAFLSPATQAVIGGGGPIFIFSRVFDDPNHRIAVRADSETWSVAAGIEGTVAGFAWDFHIQRGDSLTKNYFINNTINGRAYAALDAVDQGKFQSGVANGNIVCRVTLTNPTAYPGCVALNAFGAPLSTQQSALSYVFGTSVTRPRQTLDTVEANVRGTAFDNWAGPVKFALSGEYRWEGLTVNTNAPASLMADCTGVRFNCTQGVTSYYSNAQVTPISIGEQVGEGALEIQVPLLTDSSIGTASLDGAIRFTGYSVSGGATTWKISGEWEPMDGVRLRGTYSRDIRAPGLYDLYQPLTTASSGYQDRHTGFNGIVPTQTGGNAALVPEIAHTLTYGIGYQPSFIKDLSIQVDYYRISMSNEISQVDGRNPIVQDLCEASGGTGPFCSLFVRPLPFSNKTVANAPTLVRAVALNASSLKTWGIDAEVNYNYSIGADGQLIARGLVSYQPKLTEILLPGTAPQEFGGAASIQQGKGIPAWRLTGNITYKIPELSVDVQERWRSSLRRDPSPSFVFSDPDVSSVAYTDLTLTAYINQEEGKQIYLTVQNLFDEQPPVFSVGGFSGTPTFQYPSVIGDDVIGRFFSVGARIKF